MDAIHSRIVGNSLFVYLGRIFNLIFNFFIYLFLANYLGETAFGRLSIAIAYVGTFDIISNFGLNQILVREISKNPSDQARFLGSGIVFKILLAFVSVGTLLLIIPFLGYNRETQILIAIISINFLISSKMSSTRT
ncbi:oligosaccharide flippase family protein, partial [candidate division KSB1 bacterium]|nr:oligosaccharide flippase family protein [candidate division KSB1 bacterium]